MNYRGVIYSVTHDPAYVEAALISAIALRQLEPSLAITIVSDWPELLQIPLDSYGITVQFLPACPFAPAHPDKLATLRSRWLKTQLHRFTPYTETLFLDADILPLSPVSSLWAYLHEVDWAMACDRLPTLDLCDHVAQPEKSYTLQQVPGSTIHFNSGVILWRNTPTTRQLFHHWHQEWLVFQNQDQLALARALHRLGVSVATLPRRYNISPFDAAPLLAAGETVPLLHCWGGMVSSGEFRDLAQTYYPEVIAQVEHLWPLPIPLTIHRIRR